MKQTISYLFLLIALVFQGCSDEDPSLGAIISPEDVTWSYAETETTNEFRFVNETPAVITMWDFGNGQTATGSSAIAQYANAGTYTISIKILSQGGELNITSELIVDNNNPSFLEGPIFDFLAGGRSNPDGKIWVVDQYYKGHMGCGPTADAATGWWAANPNDKAGMGLYDDQYKFIMTDTGLKLEQYTNDDVFAQGGKGVQIGTDNAEDALVPFGDATANVAVGGANNEELSLTGDAFLGFFLGYPANYTITKLTDNELEVVYADGATYWFQRFVTLDNLTPEPAQEPLPPMSITDFSEQFDGTNAFEWEKDGANTTLDSMFIDPLNEANTVGYHTRGEADHFAATYVDLDGSIDFSRGVKIIVDVYVPSANDYTVDTKEDWAVVPTQEDALKTLEVKLHNRDKGDNSWQTQMTIKTDVLKDYEDQWVTLAFDFNNVYAANSENEDKDVMNRIIFQFGGEGWSYKNPVGVYLDNIVGIEGSSEIVPLSTQSMNVLTIH